MPRFLRALLCVFVAVGISWTVVDLEDRVEPASVEAEVCAQVLARAPAPEPRAPRVPPEPKAAPPELAAVATIPVVPGAPPLAVAPKTSPPRRA